MSLSRLLVGNLFDTSIFPGHVLDAEEEASGHEVERIATYRRAFRDRWESTTANSQTWIEVTCDQVRAANMLVIDRGHNLADIGIDLRASFDDFATYTTACDITVPSSTYYGSDLTNMDAVRTHEGAVVVEFDLTAGTAWRLYIDAMGAGLVPQLPGVWLGLAVTPEVGPLMVGYDDEAGSLSLPGVATPSLWQGSGQSARQRSPSLHYRVQDEREWSALRWHIDLYHRGYPMWVVPDYKWAERAILSRHPGGSYSVPYEGGRIGRELVLQLAEHQPKPLRSV